MLGDGMVIFGVAVRTWLARNAYASAKMVRGNVIGSSTSSAADANSSVPASLKNWTVSFSSGLVDAAELVDEVHVPGRTAELAVGRGPQADVFLHPYDVGDGRVLDGAQVIVGDLAGRALCRARSTRRRGVAGFRRGRREMVG